MSLDVDTYLIVGALLKDEELFHSSQEVIFNCDACSAAHATKQKFCGECGKKFIPRTVKSWLPTISAWLMKNRRDIDAMNLQRRFDFERPFYNVAPLQSADTDETSLAIGLRFRGPSMRMRMTNGGLSFERLERARTEVALMLVEMGLAAREISVFQTIYVSA